MSLHEDVEAELNNEFPCRDTQIRQLLLLLPATAPSTPAVVLHGLSNTAKSVLTRAVLARTKTPHIIIRNEECITGRHLLESTIKASIDAVEKESGSEIDRTKYARCENLNSLSVHLERLLSGRGKFVLVFDGIDRQREAPSTLLPALVRLNETIPNLTVVLILTSPSAAHRPLHHSTLPHINFSAYTRSELLSIVSRNPPPIFDPAPDVKTYDPTILADDTAWLWTRFLGAVYDSVGRAAARDCISFRTVAERLWIQFVQGIRDGTFGTRDFSRLVVAKRALFQGEEGLDNGVEVIADEDTNDAPSTSTRDTRLASTLPSISKFILVSAYLASYNPPRTDAVLFMRYNADKKKRKRKQNITASGPGKMSKHKKIPRRLLHPSPFTLERLLAIFHSIRLDDGKGTSAIPAQSADVLTHVATLTGLRLLVKAGATGGDVLDAAAAKWRVNVGWEVVVGVARSVNFEIEEFVVD